MVMSVAAKLCISNLKGILFIHTRMSPNRLFQNLPMPLLTADLRIAIYIINLIPSGCETIQLIKLKFNEIQKA